MDFGTLCENTLIRAVYPKTQSKEQKDIPRWNIRQAIM